MQWEKKFWIDEIVRLYFEGNNFSKALEVTKKMMMDYELLIIRKRGV